MRKDDVADLLHGLQPLEVTVRHIPSQLVAHGPGAFPVVTVGPPVVVAAARHVSGRVVHFGHEHYLTGAVDADWAAMQINCLAWCLGSRERLTSGGIIIGTDVTLDEGHAFNRFGPRSLPRSSLSIDRCQVYLTTSYASDHADRIVDFVAKGGAVLSGGHAWYWSYSNPESSNKYAMRDFPGNSWLCPLGIGVTSVASDVGRASGELHQPPGLIAMLTDDEAVKAEFANVLKTACDQVFIGATVGLDAFQPAWNALRAAVDGSVGKDWKRMAGIDLSKWLAPHAKELIRKDVADLLRALQPLEVTGRHLASQLVAHGPGAFPVVTVKSSVVVAAARHIRGRVVHFGHEHFLTGAVEADWAAMQINCLAWCLGSRERLTSGGVIIGTDVTLSEGHTFNRFGPRSLPRWSLSIDRCQVYLTTSYASDHADRIVDFVAKGGAVLSGGHAWYWSYSNPESSNKYAMRDFPGNSWLCPLGIGVTSVASDVGRASGELHQPPGLIAMLTDDEAVKAEFANVLKTACDQVFIGATVGLDAFQPAWNALRAAVDGSVGKAWLEKAGFDLSMSLVPLIMRDLQETPPGTLLLRSPLAANFPGDVAAASGDAAEGSVIRVTVDASYAGLPDGFACAADAPVWRGTGAYAQPGLLVVLETPQSMAGSGIDLLIGCHTDLVPAGKSRPPRIHCAFPIEGRVTRGFNPYGGIVYVRIPRGCSLGKQEVTVSGAVPYPVFTLGKSEPRQWLREVKETRAPMFELHVPGQLIISAPISSSKLLGDDPERVARLWQSVMFAINNFHCVFDDPTQSEDSERPREERIVLDKEISAGSMHAGYPIMGYLDYDRCLLSADKITTKDSWGPVHELGHNHQWQASEFPGTGEASNNVVNVFVHETVFDIPRARIPDVTDESRRQRRREFVAGGRDFHNKWGVWVALDTFLQLQEAFGWEPFKMLNRKYRTIGKTGWHDQERIDKFVTMFSQQVSRNLVPFFRAWGFPLSKSVDQALASLPPWDDHPMVE